MACNQKFLIGRGVKIYVAHAGVSATEVPGNGNDNSTLALENRWIATTDADAAKGGTAITFAAGSGIPAGSTVIPSNTFLNAVTPTGSIILVQLTADEDPTGAELTTIAVKPLDVLVPAGSTFEYPTFVSQRNSADINFQGNRINFFAFEDGGHESGTNSTISSTLTLNGNFAPTNAGFRNLEELYQTFCPAYFFVEFPTIDSRYQRGRIVQGIGSVTSINVSIPSDNFITGNVEAAFDAPPVVVGDDPIA